jgi:hypothetical protein
VTELPLFSPYRRITGSDCGMAKESARFELIFGRPPSPEELERFTRGREGLSLRLAIEPVALLAGLFVR